MKILDVILLPALLALATAAGDGEMMAGQWTVTIKMQSAVIPGAPPAVNRAMLSPTRNFSECVTSNPASDVQRILREAPGCSFTSFSMTGGILNAEMRCSQRGGAMTARISGTYSAASFAATSQASVTSPVMMSASSTIRARRIGECL